MDIKARLNALEKKYQEAFLNIARAVAKEDKTGTDASLRMSMYVGFRLELRQRIRLEKLMNEEISQLKETTESIITELDNSRTKIIEYIENEKETGSIQLIKKCFEP